MLREVGPVLSNISQTVDLFIISVGFYLTVELYKFKEVAVGRVWEQYFLIFLVYVFCWLISSSLYRVYQSRRFMSALTEAKRMIIAHIVTFAASMVLVTLYRPTFMHNRFVFYFEAIVLFLMLAVHLLTRIMLQTWRSVGRNTKYILILGSGEAAHTYLDKVNDNPQLGYKVIGYLAPTRNGLEVPYLGDYENLESVINQTIVDVTVITAPLTDENVKRCVELLDIMGKTVTILLDDIVAKVTRSRPIDFDGLPMVAYDGRPRQPGKELIKRVMDVSLSAIGLLAISPLFAVIAIVIKVTSKGPVFFKQERVGLNGRRFKMVKFRSMVVNAEELKAKLAHLNEMSGPVFKISNDPRVTSIGRIIRKTSIDELPQLWNVLKGDMSLVGPRPPLPSEVNMYDPKHRKRLSMKPGITCIWQISGRNEVDFEEWMEMDAEYIDQWSLKKDIEILAKTVPAVMAKKGAS